MSKNVVQTAQGKVRGIEKMGCLQFRGVPFAAPPVADLRWRPPNPPAPWEGVRDCVEFSAICPQAPGSLEQLGNIRRDPHALNEDCLYLNVFTPAADDARRPVMIWLHGGGFSSGSGRLPWYYGHNFARDGVVMVSINYRLNVFGFLELEELYGPEFAESGNCGILDQIAALHWVQENIAAFGGDPDNVTVFGESAGGGSVGTLMGSPAARGLFHKAIPQSGAAHWSHSRETATRVARFILESLGVREGDTEALRSLDAERMTECVAGLGQSLRSENARMFGEDHAGFGLIFQPVRDTATLPSAAIDLIRTGSAASIPVLVGTTKDEWKLFTIGTSPDRPITRAPRPLRNLCAAAGKSVDDLLSAYERRALSSELEMRNLLETDRTFRIPAIRLAEAQVANAAPVWMYRFDWESNAFGGGFGAAHALEIPFVFDNLQAPGVELFTGDSAPQHLATTMHAAWVAFAKTGSPATEGLPDWPGYDTESRATMIFDETSRLLDDPDDDLREAWDGLL